MVAILIYLIITNVMWTLCPSNLAHIKTTQKQFQIQNIVKFGTKLVLLKKKEFKNLSKFSAKI
jgi:hypothetical protein